MSEEVKQAVAETETQVSPATEAVSAQDTTSLDDLISEFNQATKTAPASTAAPKANEDVVLQLKQEVENLKRSQIATKERDDFTKVIKELKGDAQVPDFAVRGWLSEVAEQNPGINDIWNNRESNPAAAKKLVANLKKQWDAVQARNKPVDAEATTDKLAVAAAMRGTSTKAPEEKAPDYGAMDNASFQKELAKFGI